MSGFYLMHREWQDNPVFNNEPFSRRDAWVWLIENANYVDGRVAVKGKAVSVKRGQLCYSLRYMARAWQWDEAKVRRFLARLEGEGMIRSVSDAGQTLITICNYDNYQAPEGVDDAPTDAAPTQHRRGIDANQNEGNERNKDSSSGLDVGAPVEPEPDTASQILDAMQEIQIRVFGRRAAPNPTDIVNASRIAAAGVPAKLAADVIDAVSKRRQEQKQGPPGLAYYRDAIMRAHEDSLKPLEALKETGHGTGNQHRKPPGDGSDHDREARRRGLGAAVARRMGNVAPIAGVG